MRFKRVAATGLLALIPALSGCSHTYTVLKTRPPDVVYTASLDNLLQQVSDRYKATQTATLYVEISASTGGSREGKVTESYTFSGYIILQNPDHIRVLLNVPIYGRVLDMVSDGKSFNMRIPPKSCAIIGSDAAPPAMHASVDESASDRLYRLRPAVILDALLIAPVGQGQDVSLTQDSRDLTAPKTKAGIFNGSDLRKEIIREPDYDIEFLSQPKDQVANTLRVLHIGRSNLLPLLPYQQDIYDAQGEIETQATYDAYKKFGSIDFPTRIVISRPLDELKLTITVKDKTNFNQALGSDEFVPDPIPPAYAIQNMDDPISAKSNPCVNHGAAATPAPSTTK